MKPRTRAEHAEFLRRYLSERLEKLQELDILHPTRVGVTEGLLRAAITELGYLAESIAWVEHDLEEARHG